MKRTDWLITLGVLVLCGVLLLTLISVPWTGTHDATTLEATIQEVEDGTDKAIAGMREAQAWQGVDSDLQVVHVRATQKLLHAATQMIWAHPECMGVTNTAEINSLSKEYNDTLDKWRAHKIPKEWEDGTK